jgi:hypothetical protein
MIFHRIHSNSRKKWGGVGEEGGAGREQEKGADEKQ